MGATEHYIHMPNQEVTVLTPLSNQPVQPLSRPPTLYMDGSVKQCVNCGAIETPTWRRHPVTGSSVCNACGLYFKLHSRDRTFVYNQKGNIVVKRQTRRTTPMKQASKRRKGRVSSLKLLPGS
ncbi:Erythroid transcription factor, partial [Dipsacomyces acuminosporus]